MNRLTRRELLTVIGAVAAAGCRGAQPAATETRQADADQATVTLTVSGMI